MTDYEHLKALAINDLRQVIRRNNYTGHTAGLGKGYLQVNLAIMPEAYALDFFRYCQRNPKPCPLVGVSDKGSRALQTLGTDLYADTDAPAYAIYANGEFVEYRQDVADVWQDDFVAFALGCSFTFEHAAIASGIPMRHIECNRTVPMFRTSIETAAAGPFGGGMVVSMRPVNPKHLEDVQRISAAFPLAHGAPVHIGNPKEIGIEDISRPDYGDPVPFKDEDVPVFWACGVTPQNAARRARLPIFISHQPGAMLITDVDERANPPILS